MIASLSGMDSKLSLRKDRQELSKAWRRSVEMIADVRSRWRKLNSKHFDMTRRVSVTHDVRWKLKDGRNAVINLNKTNINEPMTSEDRSIQSPYNR